MNKRKMASKLVLNRVAPDFAHGDKDEIAPAGFKFLDVDVFRDF
jgi:hypothetical protein